MDTTLTSIFDSHKEALAEKLTNFSLPRDSREVENTVAEFFSDMFESDGSYRQSLTQSEDYILQAAISMLNAQRALVAAFDCKPEISVISESERPRTSKSPHISTSSNSTSALIAAGGGVIVGKLLFGSWGAVFGAIASTATALYLSQRSKPAETLTATTATPQSKVVIKDVPVDTPALLAVIGQICDSLDNLIATFRAQIKRVVNKYESQEKPTIEREYRVLLEGIQSLIGYKRGHSPEEEKYLSKLLTRIEDLTELLDNYSLEAVDYTPEHSDWFEAIESKNSTEIKMVTPAIIKNGGLVIKGKIFVPKQS